MEDGASEIEADRTQLEIVLHNLFSNALDALTHVPASTRAVVLSSRREGDCVLLEIEDSGPGLSAEVSGSLFEPFVTTKSDGMGLGLAIVHHLVALHGGTVEAASEGSGRGATFRVRLRAATAEERDGATAAPAAAAPDDGLLAGIRDVRDSLVVEWERAQPVLKAAGTNGGGKEASGYVSDLTRLNVLLQDFNRRGVIIKDVDRGLVDFPHWRDEREVFLCWRLGEERVAFWHGPESGFGGRRPI